MTDGQNTASHADHDNDHAYDLSRAAVERQEVDEIEHQDDDQEGDEHANEEVHALCLSQEDSGLESTWSDSLLDIGGVATSARSPHASDSTLAAPIGCGL